MVEEHSSPYGLFEELKKTKGPAIIAECKRKSPSKGIIADPYDPVKQARSYERGGARAISVLTDEKYFGGTGEDLREVAEAVSSPVMRKDFVIDEYQIYEARLLGASSFLLIAGVLDTAQLQYFLEIGRELGMEALVESYSSEDLDLALKTDAKILGINNRNLKSMEVQFDHILQLQGVIRETHPDSILVCESGVASKEDVGFMCENGIHTFLIGEFLMKSGNPEETLKSLCSQGSS